MSYSKNKYFIIKISIYIILVSCMFSGCSMECSTPDNLKVTMDYLLLARNFLDVSIIMFDSGYKSQGLARIYYMFYSIQTINIYRKKRDPKLKGEKKHVKAWSGSNAKKKLTKAFGQGGFLTIRHQCDYTNIDEETLNKNMMFWLESTEDAFNLLIDETSESINVLTNCNVPYCDCQKIDKEEIKNSKIYLSSLKESYLDFFKEYKKQYSHISKQ